METFINNLLFILVVARLMCIVSLYALFPRVRLYLAMTIICEVAMLCVQLWTSCYPKTMIYYRGITHSVIGSKFNKIGLKVNCGNF